MIRLTIMPLEDANLYGLLVAKEVDLRRRNQGTLHRSGTKKKGMEKWTHKSYPGWIKLQKCVGGTIAAVVQSRDAHDEWQLLTSLIGFLDRHFREHIGSITLSYDRPE